jgi:diadenosine tetraphosphate (Ap4A) HIT family hydrolase
VNINVSEIIMPERLRPYVVLDNTYWTLILNDNQATLGRVFFYLKRAETDVAALTPDERESLWAFLAETKQALTTLFAPDHFNYMFLMNLDAHVHMHVYPRYAQPREFAGQTFTDDHFGGHYDPQQNRPIDAVTRDSLLAALRHAMTQPAAPEAA